MRAYIPNCFACEVESEYMAGGSYIYMLHARVTNNYGKRMNSYPDPFIVSHSPILNLPPTRVNLYVGAALIHDSDEPSACTTIISIQVLALSLRAQVLI